MRYIVAALAAFLVLMLDFGHSPFSTISQTSTTQAAPVAPDTAPDAVLFSVRFMDAVAGEAPAAPVADATPSPSDKADGTAIESPASELETFCHTLKEAAEASEIPVAFFARLIWQESRFRSNEVSHAGAKGVAQFMPETAAEIGLDDPFDPLKALPASARLLRKLRDDFGNLGLAAAAYNAGAGRIQKWLARQTDLPQETRDYVRIITGTKTEAWTKDSDLLAIRADLPGEAPCEGIGGLSKSKDTTLVHALPAPGVATMIRKAEAEAEAAKAKAAAGRGRKRLALLLRKGGHGGARGGALRRVADAHARTRLAKGRPLRLAERSS
jgi:hypothetical protein